MLCHAEQDPSIRDDEGTHGLASGAEALPLPRVGRAPRASSYIHTPHHPFAQPLPIVGRCHACNWHSWLLGRELLVRCILCCGRPPFDAMLCCARRELLVRFGGRFRGRIQRFTGLYMLLLIGIFTVGTMRSVA